jgi:alanyl-tRNA synthetase
VQQRGSLVNHEHLRFDFSHFQKLTEDQIQQVERMVNARIRANIPLQEDRSISIDQAKEAGAMMLFGEKYGDTVRMITFDRDFSVELCGGCHVDRTGRIGLFKIVSESAIAAGVRRIEAVTGEAAEHYVSERLERLEQVSDLLKRPSDLVGGVQSLLDENKQLKKQIEEMQQGKVADLYKELLEQAVKSGSIYFIASEVSLTDGKAIKDLVFRLTASRDDMVALLSGEADGKIQLHLGASKALVEAGLIDASKLIRTLSRHIKGGGGGQPFYASAGGSDPSGLPAVFSEAKEAIAEAGKS